MAKGKVAVTAAPKLSRLERLQAEIEKEQAKATAKEEAAAARAAKRSAAKESKVNEAYASALKSLDVAERLYAEAQAKFDKAQARMDVVRAVASQLGIVLPVTVVDGDANDEG